ncbi:hypothetical protein JOF56_005416 [Kibdelosporangium banguiense]|uniref:ShKT domain-containing protein n=1 Tax=Kibdelosporangium banguiense TaxID=1365924 RepID=A0ABS4TMB7_9PSEU|nr:hypothetical protein [Kibdelosporangium banguiense]MBP2325031.1 hypothetical protein [Kibdelosporangium banguiense]
MRKTFRVLGDRLLSVFVAKADVGAACPPDPYYKHCYCRERTDFRKRCALTGPCRETCGPCVAYKTCGP